MTPGKIIFLHGPSSSGKSTLAKALQEQLDEPFLHLTMDHFRSAVPWGRFEDGGWEKVRPAFFEGFHRCIPAMALAGNNLIVEHIIESKDWLVRLAQLTEGLDVFLVGLHCRLETLNQREATRGDRNPGEAARDFETVQDICEYDLTVDSEVEAHVNAAAIHEKWAARSDARAFARLRGSST